MKRPFNLTLVLKRIEQAVAPYPKAAMFELYERGYTAVFEQLVACIISIRTFDEATIPVAERLFAIARTPQAIAAFTPETLAGYLHGCSFAMQKAGTILGIAKTVVQQFNGILPADFTTLTTLKGVGPKCANLSLGVATGLAAISVDVHVHRITNRWGFVATTDPEKTMLALEHSVPQKKWIDINRLLVPFGKYICTGRLPHCSTCPVLEYCQQTGVTKHR